MCAGRGGGEGIVGLRCQVFETEVGFGFHAEGHGGFAADGDGGDGRAEIFFAVVVVLVCQLFVRDDFVRIKREGGGVCDVMGLTPMDCFSK